MKLEMFNEQIIVEQDGTIKLSDRLRRAAGIEAGDKLLVRWLPPDELVVRKQGLSQDEFEQEMEAFAAELAAAGYDSKDKIIELVREVKREQAAEWTS